MPVFIAAIGGMLINIVSTLIGRALVALGFSVITYTGMSMSMGWIKDRLLAELNGLPADFLAALAYGGVGVGINIITSAILARMVIDGVSGDTFKRFVLK